ncbi:MAG: sulfatase-like hydrolase/transferase [bacterium]
MNKIITPMAPGLILLGILSLKASPLVEDARPSQKDPYNFVVILTDDQRWDTVGDAGVNAEIREMFGRTIMPEVEQYLVAKGVLFWNAFVTTPLCCPDRASTLAGGFYAHNTGVLTNRPPNGGAQKFKDSETLSTLLQNAGYQTAFIGKYMNGYPSIDPEGYVPPGWTRFVATFKKDSWLKYSVVMGRSGSSPSIGVIEDQTQYITDFQKDQALDFLEQYGDSPFLLYFSTHAPHAPATPAAGDEQLFSGYTYRGRAYGETDLSDKPAWVRKQAEEFETERDARDEFHRKQLRSLQAVDRAVGAIVRKIEEKGVLDRTVLIFTSDNGYLWGEHKLWAKNKPYEEAIRVPFVVVVPGVNSRTDERLVVANLDLGPTIFDLAGILKETDGLSLVPLLQDPNAPWREDFLVERFGGSALFAGLRTEQWKYVEYGTGDTELYDMLDDSYEEESKHNDPLHQGLVDELDARLEPLKGLVMTVFSAPKAQVGQPYSFQLTAWGGEEPYTWSIVAGQLPQGLTLESSDGLIHGTPLTKEKQKVSIKVEDSSIATQTGQPQSFVSEFKFIVGAVEEPSLTHGPMVGAVTDSSAKVWFRVKPEAEVRVLFAADPEFDEEPRSTPAVTTTAENDYTGTITLTGLVENTTYYYRILIDNADHTPTPQPQFKTFPAHASSVRVGILTDIKTSPNSAAPAIEKLSAENPDFVLVLGDWDHRNVSNLEEMRKMHQETRGDEKASGATFRANILYKFPVAHVWDDHDYDGNNGDKTFANKDEAIQAYDEYWPGYERPNPEAGIWYKLNYGELVEVFMLDLRSQRDLNTYLDPRYIPDDQSGANRDELRNDPCRSMLDGDECPENDPKGQKQWLKDGLLNSQAKWKILASTVPWNKTTVKDDAWWDFQAEQTELLAFIRDNNITGVVVVSGDIHTGGALDDGTHAGIPEMNVPSTNLSSASTSCRLHGPRTETSCGEWTHGFRPDGAGYGLISITPEVALLEARDETGAVVFDLSIDLVTTVDGEQSGKTFPTHFHLEPCYPNPFNPRTTIRFSLPEKGHTTLKVFDVLGREVATLVDDELPSGEHAVVFDAEGLASGVYVYQLRQGNMELARKAVLMK